MAKWRNANCYGYAIRDDDWWLMPGDYSDVGSLMAEHPEWKPVRKQDMRLGKEYIAYRYGLSDFHFMRRDTKGHWRHKRGSLRAAPISTKDVFASIWYNGPHLYTSKVYLFEVL